MSETRPVAAALCVLSAMALIGFIDNFVVVIAAETGLWQFHLMRSAMVLPLLALLTAIGIGTLRPVSIPAVALRSLLVSASMVIYFGTLALMPIAEAVAGLFTAPIWVLIISVVFLGQRVGRVRALAALAGFAGVLMVLKPVSGGLAPLTLLPICAGLCYALGALVTRELCRGESVAALMASFFAMLGLWGLLGVAVLGVLGPVAPPGAEGFVLRGWIWPTETVLFWTVVQAVGSIVALGFLTRSYQLADTSFVSVFEYTLLVFVSIWAWLLRGEALDTLSVLGIAVIVLSGAVIALRGR